MGPRYPVCRMFHELGKIVHNAHSVTRQQTVALLSLIWSESIDRDCPSSRQGVRASMTGDTEVTQLAV